MVGSAAEQDEWEKFCCLALFAAKATLDSVGKPALKPGFQISDLSKRQKPEKGPEFIQTVRAAVSGCIPPNAPTNKLTTSSGKKDYLL